MVISRKDRVILKKSFYNAGLNTFWTSIYGGIHTVQEKHLFPLDGQTLKTRTKYGSLNIIMELVVNTSELEYSWNFVPK